MRERKKDKGGKAQLIIKKVYFWLAHIQTNITKGPRSYVVKGCLLW